MFYKTARRANLKPWLAAVFAALGVSAFAAPGGDGALGRIAHPPLGLPSIPVPQSNPLTPAKIALGRQLFFDKRLSADGNFSCATCHAPGDAFTQTGVATPKGAAGKPLPRNTPTVINAAYMGWLMQDGEAHSLEAQVLTPLFAGDEMANPSIAAFVSRVTALPEYRGQFEIAFGESATISNIGKAIASYERTLVSGGAPFDRWRYGGDETALTEVAKAGFVLFTGKAGCSACHSIGAADALFTDQGFHNTGTGASAAARRAAYQTADLGREGDHARSPRPV